MNNQNDLISKSKLLECLKKEEQFCIKEKFNEKNTRFYLGRETVLTDIIKQIESGKYDPDPIPLPTLKPGERVRHPDYGEGTVYFVAGDEEFWVRYFELPASLYLSKSDELEVAEDVR